MQALSFLARFALFYVLLVAGIVLVVWLGWAPGFNLHTVNGQMVVLFTIVAGVPGVYKVVSSSQ